MKRFYPEGISKIILTNMVRKKSQIHKYYFDHPEIWEQIRKEKFPKECRFLDYIFKKYGKINSILDVGCGTGSHLALLRKMGYKTFGMDLNPTMIKFAKDHHPSTHFEIRDMRTLNYNGQFDSVICLCTTFSYNVSNEDVMKSLKGFYNSLKDNGILVIETFNPISFLKKLRLEESFFLEKEVRFNELGLRSQVLHTVNEREQTMTEIKTFLLLKGNKKLKTDVTTYRLFFPQEMRFFLEQTVEDGDF